MRVAVKHQVDVWVEVDLKTKQVDRVVVNQEAISRPIAYHVIQDEVYDTTRYAGKKMKEAVKRVLADEELDWPVWQIGF